MAGDEIDMTEALVYPAEDLPLTPECKHYEDYSEMPPHLAKYWHQRYNLFNLYDYDIQLTDDAWFGVTAEPIAMQIANDLALKSLPSPPNTQKPDNPRVLIDMFAGAGGNTIAFARQAHWAHVVGIERDAATLACAQHNARVYGVADRITWVHGDCLDVVGRRLRYAPWTLSPELLLRMWGGEEAARRISPEAWASCFTPTATATPANGGGEANGNSSNINNDLWLRTLARHFELFASPPWGGPAYATAETMDLHAMEPYGVDVLHREFRPFAHAMFLPRNGDLRQLADLVPDDSKEKLDVVQYLINGASKGLVAYYPVDAAYDSDSEEDK